MDKIFSYTKTSLVKTDNLLPPCLELYFYNTIMRYLFAPLFPFCFSIEKRKFSTMLYLYKLRREREMKIELNFSFRNLYVQGSEVFKR